VASAADRPAVPLMPARLGSAGAAGPPWLVRVQPGRPANSGGGARGRPGRFFATSANNVLAKKCV